MKYRITKHDKLNWAIEEWQEGGEAITRGRYVGQEKVSKWQAPKAFYNSLERAAKGLLDQAAGDALLSGEAADILSAIKLAEQRVMATLAVMSMGVTPHAPLSQEAEEAKVD